MDPEDDWALLGFDEGAKETAACTNNEDDSFQWSDNEGTSTNDEWNPNDQQEKPREVPGQDKPVSA